MKPLFYILSLAVFLGSCAFNKPFYHPDTSAVKTPPDAQSHYINYADSDSVHAFYYPVETPKASLFILHGNGGNLGGWQGLADLFYLQGYSVFIIDYPGFGNSSGQSTHKAVQAATQASVNYFSQLPGIDSTQKLLLGYSLGGNLAVKTAVENATLFDALIIEGAFSGHRAIAKERTPRPFRFFTHLAVKNTVDAETLIAQWQKPLLVIHSTDDRACPYEMGEAIYRNATGTDTKELWTIDGPHLSGIGRYTELYMEKIKQLSKK